MNTNEASLSAYDTSKPVFQGKPGFHSVLVSMECTARWLENGFDSMEAAAELRLAMQELKHCIADCEVGRGEASVVQDERAAFHMDEGELEEFRQTVEEFDDNGETSTPYDVLMYWAEHDLLDCSHFTVTDKGRALLGQEVPGFVASASSTTKTGG